MRIPKRYGESKIQKCPFCEKQATSKNKQGIPTCQKHKDELLGDLKCACGEYLESKTGKFGPYFNCINCGNINFKKAMGMNQGNVYNKEVKKETNMKVIEKKRHYETKSKETTVRSDELDLM